MAARAARCRRPVPYSTRDQRQDGDDADVLHAGRGSGEGEPTVGVQDRGRAPGERVEEAPGER